MPAPSEQRVDYRMYIGIVVFHWKLIAVCLLYGLLGGVLYVQLAPKVYEASCTLMIYRDPNLDIGRTPTPWDSHGAHAYLLTSDELKNRVARRLMPKWGKSRSKWGGGMIPGVRTGRGSGPGATLSVTTRGSDVRYCADFLSLLMEEHEAEWRSLQNEATKGATQLLQVELDNLIKKISKAEDDLIEYQRLHDIARVEAKSSLESRYLSALMERRNQLSTEVMMMESQYPFLKGASAGIISHVNALTRETGNVKPAGIEDEKVPDSTADGAESELSALLPDKSPAEADRDAIRGWQELRVKLSTLQQREKLLAQNLKAEHPQLKAIRKEISDLESRLEVAAQVEMNKLHDRHEALNIQIKAVETAEYQWQAKSLLASQRRAELKRISAVVERFEDNYRTLYSRLHDLRVSSELKAEHFRLLKPVAPNYNPVWPDTAKIMLVALVIGVGLGVGLTLMLEVLNNKLQSIRDVEVDLGVPFLGGVPYWVHSNLERTVRPIVTEQQSAGAVEAYRALRTSLAAAMEKVGEKILMFTSADSREGKTLTVLNVAILFAQMGKKVLLMDMDLRRGRLHRSLDIPREPGTTDMLRKGKSIEEVIQKTRIDNLDFVPTGGNVENSAEMLESVSFQTLLGAMKDRYDYIFVDTSPVLRVTDPIILSTQGIGTVVFIARVNRTPKPMIRYALDMMKDARVLGVIMNSIEMHKIGSIYYSYQYPNYAYYSYAYTYGYDYYHYSDETGPRRRRRQSVSWRTHVRRAVEWVRRTFLPQD